MIKDKEQPEVKRSSEEIYSLYHPERVRLIVTKKIGVVRLLKEKVYWFDVIRIVRGNRGMEKELEELLKAWLMKVYSVMKEDFYKAAYYKDIEKRGLLNFKEKNGDYKLHRQRIELRNKFCFVVYLSEGMDEE